MKKIGILKGGIRKEATWNKTKLGEPYKEALDRFREEVLGRDDFDPTALLQFGLFMSKGIINILKEMESSFGIEGQRAVNRALIKTGYDLGKQILAGIELPSDITDIELVSYFATIINTQAWTSIEDPRIENEDKCSFDIVWCPLQDIYKAFDCRVQRYFVQGAIDALRDSKLSDADFQVQFKSTIPSGGETCLFEITRRKPGEPDDWESYSKILEARAMKKLKLRKKEENKQ